MKQRIPLAVVAALTAVAVPSTAQAAERLYGISGASTLVTLQSDSPGAFRAVKAISGLDSGEAVLGIDVRPNGNGLFGVTSSSRIVSINPATGAASRVGTTAFTPGLNGASIGFDFNPTVDRIRLVTDTGQNLRLNPDTGAVATADGGLGYKMGDPGAGTAPVVSGAAYTNSVAGATMTTLYVLDLGRDVLALQAPPNDGVLSTVGAFGVDAFGPSGFDIGTGNVAFAALNTVERRGQSLYKVNVATGRITTAVTPSRTRLGGALRGLAAAGTVANDKTKAKVTVSRSGSRVRVTCSEACTFTARRGRTARKGTIGPARGSKTVTLRPSGRITVKATDAAGNSTSTSKGL